MKEINGHILNFFYFGVLRCFEVCCVLFNGLKDSEKLLSKGVYRIIKKCNADYEVRYHSLRELYKAIKNELNRGKSPLYRVISVIPGFRTHKWWKMLIAGYTYLSIISALLVNIYYRTEPSHLNKNNTKAGGHHVST